jgi:hypothetical protein
METRKKIKQLLINKGDYMGLPKLKRIPGDGFFGGGIQSILQDLNLEFSGELLDVILEKHNQGYSVEEIAEYTKRDPDEVVLALFDMARKDKKVRPLGIRYKKAN